MNVISNVDSESENLGAAVWWAVSDKNSPLNSGGGGGICDRSTGLPSSKAVRTTSNCCQR